MRPYGSEGARSSQRAEEAAPRSALYEWRTIHSKADDTSPTFAALRVPIRRAGRPRVREACHWLFANTHPRDVRAKRLGALEHKCTEARGSDARPFTCNAEPQVIPILWRHDHVQYSQTVQLIGQMIAGHSYRPSDGEGRLIHDCLQDGPVLRGFRNNARV